MAPHPRYAKALGNDAQEWDNLDEWACWAKKLPRTLAQ